MTQENVTGTWMIENTHTNQVNIIELFDNNTWRSIYSNKDILRGKWNLYNDTNKINTNIKSNLFGKKIFGFQLFPRIFIVILIMISCFWGKSRNSEGLVTVAKIPISSKINGSVVYCFEMDPEISENFYMKRWYI